MQGFSSALLAWRTRSAFSGGKRMGLWVILEVALTMSLSLAEDGDRDGRRETIGSRGAGFRTCPELSREKSLWVLPCAPAGFSVRRVPAGRERFLDHVEIRGQLQ